MSDDNSNGNEGQEVVIGDLTLTTDEAMALIESGKSFKQLSEQYPDIDFSELPKSFTQTRQELAELKKPKAPEKELERMRIRPMSEAPALESISKVLSGSSMIFVPVG